MSTCGACGAVGDIVMYPRTGLSVLFGAEIKAEVGMRVGQPEATSVPLLALSVSMSTQSVSSTKVQRHRMRVPAGQPVRHGVQPVPFGERNVVPAVQLKVGTVAGAAFGGRVDAWV